MSELQQAIELLYDAFSTIAKPRSIEGCTHCIAKKNVDTLIKTPLRAISPSDISPYAFSALTTVGDSSDYCYFLPRIVEISALEESWFPDIEVTAQNIRACGPDSWPARQREALRLLLCAKIDQVIETGPYCLLDRWICAIAIIGFDVAPHLDQIAKNSAAVLAYFEENVRCLPHSKLCNAFWTMPSPAHDHIVQWFNSEPIRRIPFEAYGYIGDNDD